MKPHFPHDDPPSEVRIILAFVLHWLAIVALLVAFTGERVARVRAELRLCPEVTHDGR